MKKRKKRLNEKKDEVRKRARDSSKRSKAKRPIKPDKLKKAIIEVLPSEGHPVPISSIMGALHRKALCTPRIVVCMVLWDLVRERAVVVFEEYFGKHTKSASRLYALA